MDHCLHYSKCSQILQIHKLFWTSILTDDEAKIVHLKELHFSTNLCISKKVKDGITVQLIMGGCVRQIRDLGAHESKPLCLTISSPLDSNIMMLSSGFKISAQETFIKIS